MRKASNQAQKFVERRVAYFPGCISREFSSGTLIEDCVENVDESHLDFNVDNGKTLGFRGDNKMRYAEVVSGGEGMTMMVRISGGRRAVIENTFMIFKNRDCNYPIRGVPDYITGVSYRTGPKRWIDRLVIVEWLRDRREISPL